MAVSHPAQASASHLRPVFAQHVIALDAEVRDKYSQMAEEEKQRRLQVRALYTIV